MEPVFWIAVSLIVYTYVIYPFLLLFINFLFSKLRKMHPVVKEENFLPSVSLIISAYNEERTIANKLNNCLTLDYPKDKLEVIVGSDGSTDATDRIVEEYKFKGVKLYRFESRIGKVNVLSKLISYAKGDIIIFSDANSIYNPLAIKELVKHFADPFIGCVCGRLILVKPEESAGGELESLYWRYETFLKKIEGNLGILLGANGGIYAIRKKLFTPPPSDTIVEDFVIPMKILEQGYKVIYEPKAVAFEETSKNISEERKRKVRIGAGDYQALLLTSSMLNIFKGLPSFAYWSHKVFRWFVPFLLIIALTTNLLLIEKTFYRILFLIQITGYIGSLIGYIALKYKKYQIRLFTLLYYFVSMNWALLVGFFKFITGTQKVTWEKVR